MKMINPIRSCLLSFPIAVASSLFTTTSYGFDPALKNPAQYEQYTPPIMRATVSEPNDGLVSLQEFQQAMDVFGAALDRGELTRTIAIAAAASPCSESLSYLVTEGFAQGSASEAMLNSTRSNLKPKTREFGGGTNPWLAPDINSFKNNMVDKFTQWCVFLPDAVGSADNALQYIRLFTWFFYQNQYGVDWVQGNTPSVQEGIIFLDKFNKQRGWFMSGTGSTSKIASWIANPRIEINDYKRTDASEYLSWNDFFTRNIKTKNNEPNAEVYNRPVTMPENRPWAESTWASDDNYRDYTVVSPTDCIVNPLVQHLNNISGPSRQYLENPLQENTILDVKGIPVSLVDLLKGAPYYLINEFIGGTGLSCVLMPNTYHHYHTPVTGDIVYASIVNQGTFGYPDWPNWIPSDGNAGRPGTDFSQFQKFQRGVIIIKVQYCDELGYVPGTRSCQNTRKTGYVASVPVGLNTIGSVELDSYILAASESNPVSVIAGRHRLGHFNYGGSLNILLFSPGMVDAAVQTRLGSQIGIIKAGSL